MSDVISTIFLVVVDWVGVVSPVVLSELLSLSVEVVLLLSVVAVVVGDKSSTCCFNSSICVCKAAVRTPTRLST